MTRALLIAGARKRGHSKKNRQYVIIADEEQIKELRAMDIELVTKPFIEKDGRHKKLIRGARVLVRGGHPTTAKDDTYRNNLLRLPLIDI